MNTDSQFLVDCTTSWMEGWKERGWKKADGTDVVNQNDLKDLDREARGLEVTYVSYTEHHKNYYLLMVWHCQFKLVIIYLCLLFILSQLFSDADTLYIVIFGIF